MELARSRLLRQLSRHKDIAVVAECSDGHQAYDAIRNLRPDLVFLDVQMPEYDGFEVVRRLPENERPEIIFVTAYDQFAIQAFDVHAVDYLLKPYSPERLEQALVRMRRRLQEGSSRPDQNLSALITSLSRQVERAKPVVVKVDGSTLLMRQAEIDWIESAGNYVKIHAGKEGHMVRETMADFEQRLDAQTFIRVHRSTIVNISRIKEIRSMASGNQELVLRDGQILAMSRTYRQKLTDLIGAI
jgi:two-component system LytT family response regulator